MSNIHEDPPAGIPEWVVTFGDMMSLLLTFFIMLVSMSELKTEKRVHEAVQALRRQFGPRPKTSEQARTLRGTRRPAARGEDPLTRAMPGADIVLGASVPFDEDSVELGPLACRELDVTIEQLRGKPQMVEVRGHTTRRPLRPDAGYRDHWDLAYERARAVVNYLLQQGIPANRIRVGVAAGNEPSYVGLDDSLRRQNARVQVLMLNQFTEDFQSAARGGQPADGSAPALLGRPPP